MTGPRGDAWSRGCVVPGGVPGPGGAWWRTPPRTATAAGGTHPTGMHSCYINFEVLAMLADLTLFLLVQILFCHISSFYK